MIKLKEIFNKPPTLPNKSKTWRKKKKYKKIIIFLIFLILAFLIFIAYKLTTNKTSTKKNLIILDRGVEEIEIIREIKNEEQTAKIKNVEKKSEKESPEELLDEVYERFINKNQ